MDAMFSDQEKQYVLLAYYLGRQKLLNCVAIYQLTRAILDAFEQTHSIAGYKRSDIISGCCLCKEKEDIFKDFWEYYKLSSSQGGATEEITDRDVENAWDDILKLWTDVEAQNKSDSKPKNILLRFEEACKDVMARHNVPPLSGSKTKNSIWVSLILSVKKKLEACLTSLKMNSEETEKIPDISTVRHLEVPSSVSGVESVFKSAEIGLKVENNPNMVARFVQRCRNQGVKVKPTGDQHLISVKYTFCSGCFPFEDLDLPLSILGVLEKFQQTCEDALHPDKKLESPDKSAKLPKTLKHQSVPDREKIPVANNKIFPQNGQHGAKLPAAKKVKARLKDDGSSRIRRSARLSGNPEIYDNAIGINDENAKAGTFPHSPQQTARQRRTLGKPAENVQIVQSKDVAVTPQSKDVVLIPSNVSDTTATATIDANFFQASKESPDSVAMEQSSFTAPISAPSKGEDSSTKSIEYPVPKTAVIIRTKSPRVSNSRKLKINQNDVTELQTETAVTLHTEPHLSARAKRYKNVVTPSGGKSVSEDKKKSSIDNCVTRNLSKNTSRSLMDKILELYRIKKIPPIDRKNSNEIISSQNKNKPLTKSKNENKSTIFSSVTSNAEGFPITPTENPNHALEQSIIPKENTNAEVEQSIPEHMNKQQAQVTPPKVKKGKKSRSRVCMPPKKKSKNSVDKEELCAIEINAVAQEKQEKATRIQRSISEIVSLYISKSRMSSQVVSEIRNHCDRSSNSQNRSIPKPFEPNFLCSINAIEQQSWSVYWYKRCSCSKTPDTASIPKVRRWNTNWIAGAMRADRNLIKSENDPQKIGDQEPSLIQDVLSMDHTEAFIGAGTEQKLNLDKDVLAKESEALVCVTNTVYNSTAENQKPSTESKKDNLQNFVTELKSEKLCADGRNGIVNNREREHDLEEVEIFEETPNKWAINALTSDPVQMKEDPNLSCCRPVLDDNQTRLRKPSNSHVLSDPDSDVPLLRIQPKRKSDEASPGRLKAKYRRDRDGNWSVLHSDVEELVSDNGTGEKSTQVGIPNSKGSQVLCVALSVNSQDTRSHLGPSNDNLCDKTKLQPLDTSLVDISNNSQLDSSAQRSAEKVAEKLEYVEFKESLVQKTEKEQIHSEDIDLCTKSQFIFSCVYRSFTDPEYTIVTPHPACFSQYPKVSARFSDHLTNASLLQRSPEKETTNQNGDMEKDYASKVFSLLFNSNNYWTRNARRKRTSLPMVLSARQNKFASLRKKKSRKALRFLGKKIANTEVIAFTSPAKCTIRKTKSEMGKIVRNEGPSPVEQLPVDIISSNLTDDIPLLTKKDLCPSLLELADVVQTETCMLSSTTNCNTLDTAEDNKENSMTLNETQEFLPQFPTNPVPEADTAISIECSSELKSWLKSRRVVDDSPTIATELIQSRKISTERDHVEFFTCAACDESVEPSNDGNDVVEKVDVEMCERLDEELLDVDDSVKDVENRENIKEVKDQKDFGSPIKISDNPSEFDGKDGGDETCAAKNLLSTWWGKLELFKEEENCGKYQIPSFLKIYKDVKQLLRMHASEKLFTGRIRGKRKNNLVLNVRNDLGKRLCSKTSKLSKVLRSFPEVNGVKMKKHGRKQWTRSKVIGRRFKSKQNVERPKVPQLCKPSPKQSIIDQSVMPDEPFHTDTKFAAEHQNLSSLPQTCDSSETLICEDSQIPDSFSIERDCLEFQCTTKNHVQSAFFESKNCSLICDFEVSSLESQSPTKNLNLACFPDENGSSEKLICSFDENPTNSTPQSPTSSHSSRCETDSASANTSECDFKLGDVERTSLEKLKRRKRGSDISGALNGMYWSNIMNPVQLGAAKEGRFLRKQRYANEEPRYSLQEKGNKRKIPGLGHCLSSPKYIGAILDADKTSVHKLFQSFSDSEEDDFSDSKDSFASLFKSSLNVTRIRSVMLDSTGAKSFCLQLPHTPVASEPKLFKPFQSAKKRRMRAPWSPENTESNKAVTLKQADERRTPLSKETQDSRTDYLNIVNQFSPSVSKAYVPLVRCPLPDLSSQMPSTSRTNRVQKIFFLLRHLRPDSRRPKGLSQVERRLKPRPLSENVDRKSTRLTRRPLRWDGVER